MRDDNVLWAFPRTFLTEESSGKISITSVVDVIAMAIARSSLTGRELTDSNTVCQQVNWHRDIKGPRTQCSVMGLASLDTVRRAHECATPGRNCWCLTTARFFVGDDR